MNKLKVLTISIIVLVMSLSLAGPSVDVAAKPRALGVSPVLVAPLLDYSVLAGAAVNNTAGATTTTGEVGVSPAAAITGFPPGIAAGNNAVHLHSNDASAIAAQAQTLTLWGALDQICDYGPYAGVTDLSTLVIGGGTPGNLPPGVYCAATTFSITTTINLTGSGTYIFKTGTTLLVSNAATVTGGDPCNVWWRIGSAATLGSTSSVIGTIVTADVADVTAMNNGATLNGRILSQAAATVTLNTNTITGPICAAPTFTTTASGPITVGGTITDTANLSSTSSSPLGGTISFAVYAPGDTTCATPIPVGPAVAVSGAGSYTSAPYTATTVGSYRWRAFYSGDGHNPAFNTACNDPGETSTVTALPVAPVLPSTGFAPQHVTVLPAQPAEKAYAALGDLWLEIPKLGVQMSIVGVPQTNGTWDVSWLGNNAGWLQGTAFPTWSGNSVITGHVWNANNKAGPFVYLNTLWYGDRIIVHAWGQQYIYEVRSVMLVRPDSVTAAFQHKDAPWLTLTTCRSYDIEKGTYRYRVLVQAVQVQIK
jgi:LPXTG-site transpeptidase (sortase) family protein